MTWMTPFLVTMLAVVTLASLIFTPPSRLTKALMPLNSGTPAEVAAWVSAGRVLMNLDEFIVRE